MIKNKIVDIYPDTIEDIIAEAKLKNFYLVNLDGRTIHNEQEYIDTMSVHFKFPEEIPTMYDCYDDWITDLSWLQDGGYKGFVLIIDYYKSFLENEPYDKYHLYDGRDVYKFKKHLEIEGFPDITRYWEYDVIKYRGKDMPYSFNIYLVDR